MKRRFKVNNKRSKKVFNKSARRIHKNNIRMKPMRGGIRL